MPLSATVEGAPVFSVGTEALLWSFGVSPHPRSNTAVDNAIYDTSLIIRVFLIYFSISNCQLIACCMTWLKSKHQSIVDSQCLHIIGTLADIIHRHIEVERNLTLIFELLLYCGCWSF
jgi:hypothetical protein